MRENAPLSHPPRMRRLPVNQQVGPRTPAGSPSVGVQWPLWSIQHRLGSPCRGRRVEACSRWRWSWLFADGCQVTWHCHSGCWDASECRRHSHFSSCWRCCCGLFCTRCPCETRQCQPRHLPRRHSEWHYHGCLLLISSACLSLSGASDSCITLTYLQGRKQREALVTMVTTHIHDP